MNAHISTRYLVVFAALTLVLVEAHEQVHAVATRLLCGGWASRVFDNVLSYRDCSAARMALVDIAAPLFSYVVLWLGAIAMWRPSPRTQALGFTLAFASLPFGRLVPQVVTVFVGNATADEYSFVRRMAGDAMNRAGAGGLAIVIALAFTLPPLVAIWRRLPADRRSRVFSWFYLLPLVFVIVWMAGLNGALAHGVLTQDVLPGWPALIAAHAALVTAVAWFGRGWIAALVEGPPFSRATASEESR